MRDYKDTERVDRRTKEMIKQNVVFVENKAGSLKRVTGTLADNGINIYGFACFDAPEFAIFRMICNDSVPTFTAICAIRAPPMPVQI